MNRYLTRRNFLIVTGIHCFVAMIIFTQIGLAGEELEGYEQGLNYYERNEIDKAINVFKESLAKEFTEPATEELKKAVDLAVNGKADEAEKALLSLLDNEKNAARTRYELGLLYKIRGGFDDAATMFYKAQVLVVNKGAAYVGVSTCKKCHLKQYKSWKTTKMAKTFDVLKPGENAEAKINLKFDPKKDYTKDAKCLECHTTGFGMPGGYKIPKAGNSKEKKRAKNNEGTTCEACHGPGSKYAGIHKNIMTKKQKYTFDKLRQAGEHKADVKSCTVCHNRRNPTVGDEFHFDYEEHKVKDTHENFPLKYQVKE